MPANWLLCKEEATTAEAARLRAERGARSVHVLAIDPHDAVRVDEALEGAREQSDEVGGEGGLLLRERT